jgi:hypothetical protein
MNENEAAFNAALSAFQAEIPTVGKDHTANVPTKAGGSYSYSYADLTSITERALPLLAKHGLSFSARPGMNEQHGFVLKYELRHKEGHCTTDFYPLPDPSKCSPQEIGSALTYARRYSLCAATGIAPGGEDDDGATAVTARSAPVQQRTTPEPKPDPLLTAKNRVMAAAHALGWDKTQLTIEYSKIGVLADASVADLEDYAWLLEADIARAAKIVTA